MTGNFLETIADCGAVSMNAPQFAARSRLKPSFVIPAHVGLSTAKLLVHPALDFQRP
jgi:hypothetical protein